MNKKNKTTGPAVLLLLVITGFASIAGAAGKRSSHLGFDVAMSGHGIRTAHKGVQAIHSDCRRDAVVWSGGVARRGPDRISPRPVRSRWQRSDESRIYCAAGNPFSQRPVADQTWIR